MSELTIDPETYAEKLPGCAVGEMITCTAKITEVGEGGVKAEVEPESLAKSEAPAGGEAEGGEELPMPDKKRSPGVAAVLAKRGAEY